MEKNRLSNQSFWNVLVPSLDINNIIDKSCTSFINTVKLLVYKENPSILEKIDIEDDDIFRDPLLYAYFNSKKDNLFPNDLLNEILQGYFVEKRPLVIDHSYNKTGIAYLPELGYYIKSQNISIEPILKIDNFEIIKEIHPVLDRYFVEFYKGHIIDFKPEFQSTWRENHKELAQAIEIVRKNLPDFYKELLFANKKIYLHNNPKILNFTSVETLGMLFFYVTKGDNFIYYIEELIHQGSHNFLYYVIQDRKDFFKIDVDNLMMRDFTRQKWDYRTIYGAFHGLYTVTRRVECFDILLDQNVFIGKEKHELLGRLADQFSRFRTGLELLNFNEVYTEEGYELYKQLDNKCESILRKYEKLKSEFDLSNRDLDFRYHDFCKLNSIKGFYAREEQGYYNF